MSDKRNKYGLFGSYGVGITFNTNKKFAPQRYLFAEYGIESSNGGVICQ